MNETIEKSSELPTDEQVDKALAQFAADHANAPAEAPAAPITHVEVVAVNAEAPTPAAPTVTVENTVEEDKGSVEEKDIPASLTVRHTVPSFVEMYGVDKVMAQNVLNFLVHINEGKRVKLPPAKGVGKGRRSTVYALPATLNFGLEV